MTVQATVDGLPASNADVLVDDEYFGTTDFDGKVSVTWNEDDTESTVEYDGMDAELRFDFD